MELTAELALRICMDMPAGVLLIGRDHKILNTNNYFCTRVDFEEGELLQLKITELMLDSAKYLAMSQRLQDGLINSFDIIIELKKSGDTPKWRRTIVGILTVQRQPPIGDFQHAIAFFKPFEGIQESWTSKLEFLLELTKKYSKLILLLVSTIIGLLTGASKLTWDSSVLEKKLDELQKQVDSSGSSGSSSSLPSDGSPIQP